MSIESLEEFSRKNVVFDCPEIEKLDKDSHARVFEHISEFMNVFYPHLDRVIELGLWATELDSIVFTTNLRNSVEQYSRENDVNDSLSNNKGEDVFCKTISNKSKSQTIIFCDWRVFFMDLEFIKPLLIQIVTVFVGNSSSYKKVESNDVLLYTFSDYITSFFYNHSKAFITNRIMKESFGEIIEPKFNFKSFQFINEFKKKIKRALFYYNREEGSNDERLMVFWDKAFGSFNSLFDRLIQSRLEKEKISQYDDEIKLCGSIIDELEIESHKIAQGNESLVRLTTLSIEFLSYFSIEITEGEENFHIGLPKNPKAFFKKDIVDVEPRFVAFLDILGFSQYIQTYENSNTTILDDIKESFETARQVKDIYKSNLKVEGVFDFEYLEYKVFSDNICISLPYFDTQSDYLSNLFGLITFIRSLQFLMMSKGIFIRGGISTGTYYSDDNIIFSEGLINAYKIEQSIAKYPRIVLDSLIVKKIHGYGKESLIQNNLKDCLLRDFDNEIFLNPFDIADSGLNQVKDVVSQLQELDPILSDIYSELFESISTELIESLEPSNKEEESVIEDIELIVKERMNEFHSDERIYSKYAWVYNLILWRNGENQKLNYWVDSFEP